MSAIHQMLLAGGGVSGFVFNQTISANTQNYNLRAAAVTAGWDQVKALNAVITVAPGVVVGSASTGSYGFDTGVTFPSGTSLTLVIGSGAYVVGMSGSGGIGAYGYLSYTSYPGGGGGPALRAQQAISITNNGTIGGGGGGGGGGAGSVSGSGKSATPYYGPSGGNGAGYTTLSGASVTTGQAGSGGSGAGGGLGSGGGWSVGAGGAAGAAVNGNSNITWVTPGTRLGGIS